MLALPPDTRRHRRTLRSLLLPICFFFKKLLCGVPIRFLLFVLLPPSYIFSLPSSTLHNLTPLPPRLAAAVVGPLGVASKWSAGDSAPFIRLIMQSPSLLLFFHGRLLCSPVRPVASHQLAIICRSRIIKKIHDSTALIIIFFLPQSLSLAPSVFDFLSRSFHDNLRHPPPLLPPPLLPPGVFSSEHEMRM